MNIYVAQVSKKICCTFFDLPKYLALSSVKYKISKLTYEQRNEIMPSLIKQGWHVDVKRDAINKDFKFRNFKEAWAWMNVVAEESEKVNHHPEWRNVYNLVHITWVTHACSGLSIKDTKMAAICDASYEEYQKT